MSSIDQQIFSDLVEKIQSNLNLACEKFPPLHSHHETYAVIKEELDEYFEQVRRIKPDFTPEEKLRHELEDIASMAIRGIIDLCKTRCVTCGSIFIYGKTVSQDQFLCRRCYDRYTTGEDFGSQNM